MRNRSRRRALKKCLKKCAQALLQEVQERLQDQRREKRVWMRDWLHRRNTSGASGLLLRELAVEDEKEYAKCLRMTPENFETLLELITPKVQGQDTVMREAITPRMKLEVTLHYLATGNSYASLQYFFRISKAAIAKLIPVVCQAITDMLSDYIKVSGKY